MIYQGHMWSVYSELQEWKQEMEMFVYKLLGLDQGKY